MKTVPRPPRAAEALLRWLLVPTDRDAVLGDLSEQFARHAAARGGGRRWYWAEVLRTSPGLAGQRFGELPALQVLLALLVAIAAWLAVAAWDVYVSRAVAGWLAGWPASPALWAIRSVYFALYVAGAGIVGGLVAYGRFNAKRSFSSNALLHLGPVFALMSAVTLATLLAMPGPAPVLYIALKTGLNALALVGGARFVALRSAATR